MKMNHIDGNKISPMAIIACVSAKHKTGKTNTFKLKEYFEQEEQIHDSIDEYSNSEQTEDIEDIEDMEQTEEIEEIDQTKEIEEIEEIQEIQDIEGMEEAVDKYHYNKLTHPAKPVDKFFDCGKTNYIDCSKKSPNSLLATIFAKQSNDSQNPLGKTIKEEEKQIIVDSDDKLDDETKNDYIDSENITESLQTTQPIKENIDYELEKTSESDSTTNNSEEGKTEDISGPCFQVVLLSTDDNGELGIEDNSKEDTQKDDSNWVNENGPKIIEIPSGILASFLGVLNSNAVGIPLDSMVKITKVSEAKNENYEEKNADEECDESCEEKNADEEYNESYEEKSLDEYCFESCEDESVDEYYYESCEDKSAGEYYCESCEDKSTDEYYYESCEDKSTDEYYYKCYEDKSTDEYYYECYEDKNPNGYGY
ncbi:hypothetical protein [Pseudobacteroides cellulosolvens]|uniref:Uncharacterized protein n=1 Tax=Pseudobacteroides cellulosolvens ATCC 35603 = DSM 2933 TaxID=398512 RepID=A0A0L6JQK1_9FIRM|nr:hypothetical protein [Pseudobacteroides cellulosolvens]KNY27970.1 hypothetical protein Bccel_3241 [Pseudobacteroides cellulosolvens ATCC 35603 = DSM 2933]